MSAKFCFSPGQVVRLRELVWDEPSGDSPGGVYGRPGDKLIVAFVGPATWHYPIAVSHEEVTYGITFSVKPDEIEPWDASPSTPPTQHNVCPDCGKHNAPGMIHTCTPPVEQK